MQEEAVGSAGTGETGRRNGSHSFLVSNGMTKKADQGCLGV